MKKTLAAVAVLGAFAGTAIAADVTLYGVVDAGFQYNHIDMDGASEDIDTFEMKSGQQSGSRWGLKGTEDLGNGLTVGFVLENGFTFDDGADGGDHMFDRESMLFLEGGFGKLAFGRIGTFNQGQGSFSQIGGLTPFGTSWGYAVQAGTAFMTGSRYENSIVYQTPSFAGFQVTAMYSMGGQDEGENESTTDRYYGVAASYKNGPLFGYLAVDSMNYKSWDAATDTSLGDIDDKLTVTLGASYDFEVVKLFLMGVYFDHMPLSMGFFGDENKFKVGDEEFKNEDLQGFGINTGINAPVLGGNLRLSLTYMNAEPSTQVAADFEVDRCNVTVGWEDKLSKRTTLYLGAAWTQDDYQAVEATRYSATVGLIHSF